MSDQAISSTPAAHRTPARATPAPADLRLVSASRNRSRSRQIMGALALVIMFSALLASAVFHSVLVGGQQRLDRLDTQVEQRQRTLSNARLRVAQLSSPGHVVAAAKRSGMVLPASTKWLSAVPPPTVGLVPPTSAPATSSGKPGLATGGGGGQAAQAAQAPQPAQPAGSGRGR